MRDLSLVLAEESVSWICIECCDGFWSAPGAVPSPPVCEGCDPMADPMAEVA